MSANTPAHRLLLFLFISIVLAACGAEELPEPTQTSAPPTETAAPTATERPTPIPRIGTDIKINLPEGDPESGESLAGTYFCRVCHGGVTGRGPTFASEGDALSVTDRASLRIADPAYTGEATNVQEYLIESLVVPDIYISPGEWDEHDYMGVDRFDEKLSVQDVADLLAWLNTID